jgi:hypothetical protein
MLDEREFNARAGIRPDTEQIPSFLRTEPLSTTDGDSVFDLPDELIASFWDEL